MNTWLICIHIPEQNDIFRFFSSFFLYQQVFVNLLYKQKFYITHLKDAQISLTIRFVEFRLLLMLCQFVFFPETKFRTHKSSHITEILNEEKCSRGRIKLEWTEMKSITRKSSHERLSFIYYIPFHFYSISLKAIHV